MPSQQELEQDVVKAAVALTNAELDRRRHVQVRGNSTSHHVDAVNTKFKDLLQATLNMLYPDPADD